MNSHAEGSRVFGWGYEGRSVSELIDFCSSIGNPVVVDVRLNAISRKRGFSKTALRSYLEDAGIDYVHLRALGNPKENRPGFWDPGTSAARRAHSWFRNHVLEGSGADELDELARLAKQRTVVLLCFEVDQQCCHRDLVAAAVNEELAQNSGALWRAASAETLVG
ncbi:MAG: DUF488 domain-containing protein [Scrofimicrobium sp.]